MNVESRDRDLRGRPRNARPRDALGRPLPRDAVGEVPRVPENLDLTPSQALVLGQEYLDAGLPFHAHEVFEAEWKTRPSEERDLWQGLAQLAVGITHALRGNRIGADALLRRGAERLERYRGPTYGVDIPAVLRQATRARAGLGTDTPPASLVVVRHLSTSSE